MRSLNLNSATHLNIQRKPLLMTSQCSLPHYKITNLFCKLWTTSAQILIAQTWEMYLDCLQWSQDGPHYNFSLRRGSTRNIADAPTKILGRLLAISASKTKNTASSKLEKKVLSALQRIDDHAIRGKYKVCIWKNYLAPSLHFHLVVDLVKKDSISKIQGKVTKFIKKCLNLPKCCTLALVFHPDVLKLPFLPHCQESAKKLMLMITAAEPSKEPLVKEY